METQVQTDLVVAGVVPGVNLAVPEAMTGVLGV